MSITVEPRNELIDTRTVMNTRRSIHVLGKIDEAMIGRLTPRLLRLRDDPEQPISVIIDSEDGQGRRWSTVGVSANIIDASFEALLDAIQWKLVNDCAPQSAAAE